MGQYYYAAILRRRRYSEKKDKFSIDRAKKESRPLSEITKLELYCPFDYDNFLKLLEHSYWGNEYAMTVESQLIRKRGAWEPPNFAVIGDYADVRHYYKTLDDNCNEIYNLCTSDAPDGPDFYYFEEAIRLRNSPFSDQLCIRNAKNVIDDSKTYYAWNWTKKQYVRMDCCPEHDNDWPVKIDPLFLLCAVGNGRGGGDYYGSSDKLLPDEDKVGYWAFDQIEISKEKPWYSGWDELKVGFVERYE